MVFFHFGRSKDLGGNDYFIYIGSKTKACLSNGLLRRLPHKQIDTINSQRVQWFAFNQDYEWFSAFNKSGGYLGGSSADWSTFEKSIDNFLNDATNSHLGPRVVFGPNGNMICWTSRSNGRMGAPKTASRWAHDQRARMDKLLLNEWTGLPDRAIQLAALGYRGAYFIKFDDDSVRYDLKGYYPALERHLSKVHLRSINFLALHPYDRDQYFLTDNKGDIRAALSGQIERQLRSTLQDEQRYTRGMKIVIEVIGDRWLGKGSRSETMLVVREIEVA